MSDNIEKAWEEFTESDDCVSTGDASWLAFRAGYLACAEAAEALLRAVGEGINNAYREHQNRREWKDYKHEQVTDILAGLQALLKEGAL